MLSRLNTVVVTLIAFLFFRPAAGVAQVALALPKTRNALSTEFWAEAKDVFDDLGADGSVRAVVCC